jgi:hypothetical protein
MENNAKLIEFIKLLYSNQDFLSRFVENDCRWEFLLTGYKGDSYKYLIGHIDEYASIYNSDFYIPILRDFGSDDVIIYTGNEFIVGHFWTKPEYHDNGRFTEPQEMLDWLLNTL